MRDPFRNRIAGLIRQLELNRSLRFLLHDDRACGDGRTMRDVIHAQAHEIARAQLAIDGEIKQREIAQATGEL